MRLLFGRSTIALAAFVLLVQPTLAQSPEPNESGTVRVRVTMKSDGSRTVYKFDDAHRKAVATTTDPDDKVRQRIDYDLDEFGRFASGKVFGPDGRLLLRPGMFTTAQAGSRRKPKAQKTARFWVRSFTLTTKAANKRAIQALMALEN
jgi:hypothetical protein